ncbi:LpqB family beta-propeller domain-containing protein [Actinocrispum sp. NPDC049592]|uniref:LpqB family beta-propeller domain-containing protein n=1 Tax=Actinocrispum sp. NPDC049592 TaxID=3154835 RepID=UPI0034447586
MTRLVLALLAALLLTSCANIPEQTAPQVVPQSETPLKQSLQGPVKDADAISVVRDFIKKSGKTAVAQAYLTEDAKRVWRPDNQPTIIGDDFSTVPQATGKENDPNLANVEVKGTKIGMLNSDKSFVSQPQQFTETVKLAKQDGQWRISEVPGNGLVVPLTDFNASYRPVRLYFYDGTKTVLVPDLRYLPGAPLAAPSDIVSALLAGPAQGLRQAMRSELPPTTFQRTNAVQANGALVVNLSEMGSMTAEDKELVAQQLVLSLQDVASTVRIQVEGLPLMPDKSDWRTADLQGLTEKTTPGANLPGDLVFGNRLRSLKDNQPVQGPAGDGTYHVESAARSVDGSQLAVVDRVPNGLQLRVGGRDEGLRDVGGVAKEMTRPTWQFGLQSNQIGNEVWTVADGAVIRMSRTKESNWQALPVNYTELAPFGKITELRLSRDGVRVAVVAGGKLYIGAVARSDNGGVTISGPKPVPEVNDVVSVDWLNQSTVMVATNSPTAPVWRVPVDGVEAERFSPTNLTLPLTSITAAPSRVVIVTDAVGLWQASEAGQIWTPYSPNPGPSARPFYPG